MSWLDSYQRDFPELPASEGEHEALIVRDLAGVAIHLPPEAQWAFYQGAVAGIELGRKRAAERKGG